jgi:hypothetical protein
MVFLQCTTEHLILVIEHAELRQLEPWQQLRRAHHICFEDQQPTFRVDLFYET